MSERKIVNWITIKGIHIPIFEKESEQDSYNRAVAKHNEELMRKQIAESKQQAEQAKASQLPKRIYYDDIPAEVASKTTDVLDLSTRKRYKFQDGTMITEVNAFAGKGCSRPYQKAERYANIYGGKIADWQHCAGYAYITDGIKVLKREIHWSQLEGGVMREAFIKYYKKKGQRK